MEQALVSPILWVMYIAAFLVAVCFGLLYSYHWVRYSTNRAMTFFSIVLYSVGCFILFVAMLASIVAL